MPYIVTITELGGRVVGIEPRVATPVQTRTAVATLDEARQVAYDTMHADQMCVGMARAEVTLTIGRLPESGGTIGPLPDGTVIAVKHVTWEWLWRLTPLDDYTRGQNEQSRAAILAAFNARNAHV